MKHYRIKNIIALYKYILVFVLGLIPLFVEAVSTGEFVEIRSQGKTLSVENASFEVGAKVSMWTETGVSAQRWKLIKIDVDTYSLQNAYSHLFLCTTKSPNVGVVVAQREERFVPNYGLWKIKPISGEENKYYLCPANKDNLYLSVEGGENGIVPKLIDKKQNVGFDVVWTIKEASDVATSFNVEVRDAMVKDFMKQYYHSASTGHVLGGGGWWGDAEMFETILDAFATTGDKKYQDYFHELYINFLQRNGTDWSGNAFNDDITWMVLACIRAYKYFGNNDYLDKAKSNYDKMYTRAAILPRGTLKWKQDNPDRGTTSCINCPAIIAACYLAQLTGDKSYYQKAVKIYSGQRSILFNPETGQVYDSVGWNGDDTIGIPNYWASTYNQGTMLGAATMLYQYTGNPVFIQDADKVYAYTLSNLCNANGIIKVCQTVNGDLCGFKGILMRYVRLYGEYFGHDKALSWIGKNAFHAFQNRNSAGVTWSKWLTKTAENFKDGDADITNDAFGASTAVSAAANAHVNALFHKNAYAIVGVEHFDDIKWMQISGVSTSSNAYQTTFGLKDSYIAFKNVDFENNVADLLHVYLCANTSRAKIAVYVDSVTETSRIGISDGFVSREWSNVSIKTIPVSGVHTLYLVVQGSGGVSISNFSFSSTRFLYPDLTDNGGTISTNPLSSKDDGNALIDNDPHTTCTFDGEGNVSLTYISTTPIFLKGYAICSSENTSHSSPQSWLLEGSNNGTDWMLIDQRSGQKFSYPWQKDSYDVQQVQMLKYIRLTVTQRSMDAPLEIADWQLYGIGLASTDITDDGGTFMAEGFNGESKDLIDNDASTFLLAVSPSVKLRYKATAVYKLQHYSITSSKSENGLPISWKLYGSEDGSQWTLLDERSAQTFVYNNSTNVYSVETGKGYRYFVLEIEGTKQNEAFQIADWQLVGVVDYGTFYRDVTAAHGHAVSSDGSSVDALFDDNGRTSAVVSGPDLWWQYTSPVAAKFRGFSIVSGADAMKMPSKIVLQGSDNGSSWSTICTASPNFTSRGDRYTKIINDMPYSMFRLKVMDVANNGTEAELAEWEIFGTAISSDNTISPKVEDIDPTNASVLKDRNENTVYAVDISEPVALTYILEAPAAITSYGITSGTQADSDPTAWTLEGSSDGITYEVIDSRENQSFATRYSTQFYDCNQQNKAFSYYRIKLQNRNEPKKLEMAEWQLLKLSASSVFFPVTTMTYNCKLELHGTCINYSIDTSANLNIYNAKGVLQQSSSLSAGTGYLQVDKLPKGVYVAVLFSENNRLVKKFVLNDNF